MSIGMSKREQHTRRFVAVAATLGAFGVALNLTGDTSHDDLFAKLAVGAGLFTMIWSIHRFGRLGPDPVLEFAPEGPLEPRRRKKKKKRKAAPSE